MPLQQDNINAAINQVLSFRGQRIAMPNGSYYGECTAPVIRMFEQLGLPHPSMYGNRADGWGVKFPPQLAPFFSNERYQPGKAYPRGSIMMWNSPHIGVVLAHNGSNTAEVLQQNADPDGAPVQVSNRVINNQWHTCTFVMVPIISMPPPAHPCTYSPEPDANKVLIAKKEPRTEWWNLNGQTIADFHPAAWLNPGDPFPVGGYAHHRIGYTYAMTSDDYQRAVRGDYSNNNGVNILDLKEVPPLPPPSPPKPPAAPEPYKLAERYTLVTDVVTFPTAIDANMDNDKAQSILGAATYYVWGSKDNAKLLGTSNMHKPDPETWVNIKQNVLPVQEPKPEPPITEVSNPLPNAPNPSTIPDHQPDKPVVPVLHPIFDDSDEPIVLVSTNSITIPIKSLDGDVPGAIDLPPHKELVISHWFEYRGNVYYQDETLHANSRFYALSEALFPNPDEVRAALIKAHQEAEQRVYSQFDSNRDGEITISDFIDIPMRFGGKVYNSGKAVISTAMKSPQVKKFIDGFRAANKKDRVRK